VLFVIEFIIAVFVPSPSWLRDSGGDMLIIPLIYCIIRIFIKKFPRLLPFFVCCIGFAFEIAQYFQISDRLGFERGSIMSILIGTSFTWMDMFCYVAGMLMIYTGIFIRKKIKPETCIS
jgi:hypothetical protein